MHVAQLYSLLKNKSRHGRTLSRHSSSSLQMVELLYYCSSPNGRVRVCEYDSGTFL